MLITVDLNVGLLTPPSSVARSANMALEWNKRYQRGLMPIDMRRAELLQQQRILSKKSLLKMWNYFQVAKEEVVSDPPTNQQILWAGYGGKPALHWLKLLEKRGLL